MIRIFSSLSVILCFVVGTVSAQTYKQLVAQADSLYRAQDYKKSSEKYQRAFLLEKKNAYDLYNGACSAALAGDKDPAFTFLQSAIDQGWTNINHLSNDSDLNALHSDKRWKPLIDKLQAKVNAIEAKYDKPLQQELLQIYKDDQGIRQEFMALEKQLGFGSSKVDSLGRIMRFKDSVNLVKVKKILDEKGWVGKDKVGAQANQTLFLVIQHSDLETQQKYLPMMREAVKKGNAEGSALALLEDRIALRNGKKQIYGSQIFRNPTTQEFYVAPLEDPDKVDERRASVGLNSIADYVQQWNLVWDVVQYKKQLPQYELWLKDRGK